MDRIGRNGPGFKAINIGTTEIKGIEASITGQGKLGPNLLNILAGYLYNQPTALNYLDVYAEEPYENYYTSSSNNYNMNEGLYGTID